LPNFKISQKRGLTPIVYTLGETSVFSKMTVRHIRKGVLAASD
jgi:hypothetical protein